MVNQAPADLTRINLNLYTTDLEFLKLKLGYGWTIQIRELVREYTLQLRIELKTGPKP